MVLWKQCASIKSSKFYPFYYFTNVFKIITVFEKYIRYLFWFGRNISFFFQWLCFSMDLTNNLNQIKQGQLSLPPAPGQWSIYENELSSELKTLEWDILNPDRLIWVSNVHTFNFFFLLSFLEIPTVIRLRLITKTDTMLYRLD